MEVVDVTGTDTSGAWLTAKAFYSAWNIFQGGWGGGEEGVDGAEGGYRRTVPEEVTLGEGRGQRGVSRKHK